MQILICANGTSEQTRGRSCSLWTMEVHLINGCLPKVGMHPELDKNETKILVPPFEPARWYPVLVLNAICIDCTQKRVSWSVLSDDQEYSLEMLVHYRSDKESSDEEREFDGDDELFALASTIIQGKWGDDGSGEDKEKTLIRLLHCYVLPKITLRSSERRILETALEKQTVTILSLDEQAEKLAQTVHHYKMALYEMHTKVEDVIKICMKDGFETASCSQELLKHILEDLYKHEEDVRQQLDVSQEKLDRARSVCNTNSSEEDQSILAHIQEERDEYSKQLMSLLGARSTLLEAQDEMCLTSKNNCQCPDILCSYTNIRKTYTQHQMNLKNLVKNKTYAVSIREKLEETLEELKRIGSTRRGETCSPQGSNPTDVMFEDEYQPEWQTTAERVASMVMNTQHPIGCAFRNFCLEIWKRCEEATDAIHSTSFTRKSRDISGCFKNGCDAENLYEDAYGDFNYIPHKFRKILETLKSDIQMHIERVTAVLTDHFPSDSRTFQHKLHQYYAKYLFEEVGESIMSVYKTAYKQQSDILQKDVERLQNLPILCLNLGMKDEWWLHLFEQNSEERQHAPTAENQRPILDREMSETSVRSLCLNAIAQQSRSVSMPCSIDDSFRSSFVSYVDEMPDVHDESVGSNPRYSISDILGMWEQDSEWPLSLSDELTSDEASQLFYSMESQRSSFVSYIDSDNNEDPSPGDNHQERDSKVKHPWDLICGVGKSHTTGTDVPSTSGKKSHRKKSSSGSFTSFVSYVDDEIDCQDIIGVLPDHSEHKSHEDEAKGPQGIGKFEIGKTQTPIINIPSTSGKKSHRGKESPSGSFTSFVSYVDDEIDCQDMVGVLPDHSEHKSHEDEAKGPQGIGKCEIGKTQTPVINIPSTSGKKSHRGKESPTGSFKSCVSDFGNEIDELECGENHADKDGMTKELGNAGTESTRDLGIQTQEHGGIEQYSAQKDENSKDTFDQHFGNSLKSIKNVLISLTPQGKLHSLVTAWKQVTFAVTQLRMRDTHDVYKAAVCADDLLGLVVLLLLQLTPQEVAAILPHLTFSAELMPPFLSTGCHGYILTTIQNALYILTTLCHDQ